LADMKLHIPLYPRRLTLITVLFGIGVFMWLSPDEQGWLVIPLGIGMATLIAIHTVFRLGTRWQDRAISVRWVRIGVVALGALIGGGSAITTALLMLFKSALHNHVFPDYPLIVVLGILQRLPLWSLAGVLIGLAVALLLRPNPQ
jgi:hypothetical protein